MYLKPKVTELKKRREYCGLTKHQVSLLAGLGNQALSRIERGETKAIHPLRAKEIARVLNCDIRDIFEVNNHE